MLVSAPSSLTLFVLLVSVFSFPSPAVWLDSSSPFATPPSSSDSAPSSSDSDPDSSSVSHQDAPLSLRFFHLIERARNFEPHALRPHFLTYSLLTSSGRSYQTLRYLQIEVLL
ncbi:hypothetical protein DFP72DRAFT_872921 [Ephemerocybe angulata]|uniref:Uncharacterized protein n=1 Tax=Ephemerocybe angulata TaxID=980116 RepID=A0A8H6IDR7_9AGAR|nr:hypothetical protein DFP72DRAFT_872921 [Tulosesus angulatus]